MRSLRLLSLSLILININFSYATELSLKSAFKEAFKVGMAINDDIASGKSAVLQNIVKQHANTVTLENSMKAEIVNPTKGVYNFAAADQYIDFAQQQNMFIIGHTLVWHNQTPDWFFLNDNGTANTPEQQLERMHQYIKVVAGRYSGKVDAWDVVNEIIGEDGNYRNTIWVDTMKSGDDVVKAAFKYAEKYSPNTELYYNDFNAWRPKKRDGIIRMVKMLKANGIRIDGIGIQAHWGLNFPKKEYIEAAIDAYSALGLKVMITELDVDVLPITKEGQVIGTGLMHPQYELEEFEQFLDPYKTGLPKDIEEKLTARYQELFEIFYHRKEKIDRVTFWGVDDSMSWKNNYPIPNRTNYPLLWDRNLQPKKAVEAILNVPK
ncbi:endo-1,4-beta-xylanase [Thalassotalea piscium]